MSSGGKGGAKQQSKNYYGTLIGAVSWGPWDWISAIIHNGNYIFQGELALTDDVTDLTGSIVDPTLIAPGGSLKLYRGTETQPADSQGRRDKGTVKLEAIRIFFGQDSGTAPNLQIIGGGLPRVPTSVVAEADNVADDGQINPVAAWAEILLDERGGGLVEAQLDTASWLAAAHWAYLNKGFTFCSPLITEQGALRDIAKSLLEPFNGFCRWTNSGKLACNVYEWGVDPGGLPTLDAQHLVERPQMPLGDWDKVPTELLLTFNDRDYEFQNNSHLVPNVRAQQVRQVDDQARLDRPHVTRIAQVHKHGVEYLRRVGTSPSTMTFKVRRPFVAALSVGDKIRLDVDPEPGGGGLSQLARVERIKQDRSDAAQLTLVTDNLVEASAYTPGFPPPAPVAEVSPPFEHFLAVPLPPVAFGLPRAVGLLVTRPTAAIVRFGLHFSDASAGSYDQLGTQEGFAVRAQLAADILAGDGTIDLTELDGLTGPDAGLADNTPGGNPTAAANNSLLALLCNLDGDGRIALDVNGDPEMEFVSIEDRAPVSGATHSYTVLRGRLGTTARAWTTGTVAWITPQFNLFPWRHELFDVLQGEPAFFRLVSETPGAIDDTIPVPECSVNMIPDTAPMLVAGVANVYFDFIFKRAVSAPATPTGNAPAGWSDAPPGGTDALWMSRGQRRKDTGALLGVWSPPVRLDGEPGVNGVDGVNGQDGIFREFVWKRAASIPTTPAGNGIPAGWSDDPPSGSDPLWMSVAKQELDGTLLSGENWSTPIRHDGPPGVPGVDGNDGVDGVDGIFREFVWKRASSAPSTPSGNGIPSGWSDDPPAGSDPLWMSVAKQELDGTLVAGESWSTPVRHDGPPGLAGTDGDSVEVEYSIDGSTSWHSTFTTGDIYMRQRIGSGSWSGAIRIVGEQGPPGSGTQFTLSLTASAAPDYNVTGSGTYDAGDLVAISAANPPVGAFSSFLHWTGGWPDIDFVQDVNNNNTYVLMNKDISLIADYI